MRKKTPKKEALPLAKPKLAGRPTDYSQEKADRICQLVSTHPWGLKKICAAYPDIPKDTTIFEWILKIEVFARQYARAKFNQVEVGIEDCHDMMDELRVEIQSGNEIPTGTIMAMRTIFDTRKWVASKLAPKIYGDKIQIEQKEEENEKLREEVLQLRAKLDKKNKKDY